MKGSVRHPDQGRPEPTSSPPTRWSGRLPLVEQRFPRRHHLETRPLVRSLKDLVNLVNEIQEKVEALHSLNDQIDTTTPHTKFTFHMFAALAEFERDIIRERTKAGLTAARA